MTLRARGVLAEGVPAESVTRRAPKVVEMLKFDVDLEVILAVRSVGAEGAAKGLLPRVCGEVVGKVLPLVPATESLVAHEAQQGHVVGYRPLQQRTPTA